MTMPNEFKLNSDYLPLAQVNHDEFTAAFGSETFPVGEPIDRYQDFTIKNNPGAIDRIMISHNNGNYTVGNMLTIDISPQTIIVNVYRTAPNTLRVRLHGYSNQSYTMPAQTIKVKVDSFIPPNLF